MKHSEPRYGMPAMPAAKVLVVDDSHAVLDSLQLQLGDIGLTVNTASDGESCLRAIASDPPDIVLLDIIMPGIDGYETCLQIKQSPAGRDLPVVFMTSLEEVADKLRGFEVGGADYLHKPFDIADLAARLRVHLLLRQRNQELAQAMARLLRSEKLLLSGKLAAAGQLSAGIAHEIANPSQFAGLAAQQLQGELAEVHAFLRTLAGDDADAEVLAAIESRFSRLQELAGTIREGTARVHAIAQDLRVFARRDDEAMRLARLAPILAATVSLVRAQFRHDLDIELELRDDPELRCSPSRIGQVLMNLLVNACQAVMQQRAQSGPDYRGRVGIVCARHGERLDIVVSDNGCGITAEVKAHIFDPFYTTKPAGEGSGLGMALAHAIVRDHRGELHIDSSPGEGARITLSLPVPASD